MLYSLAMTNSADHAHAQTVMMPVTTLEEASILSDEERALMLASMREAEARIASGEYTEFAAPAFKERLLAVFHTATTTREA